VYVDVEEGAAENNSHIVPKTQALLDEFVSLFEKPTGLPPF
jgi:hypothetical protein